MNRLAHIVNGMTTPDKLSNEIEEALVHAEFNTHISITEAIVGQDDEYIQKGDK